MTKFSLVLVVLGSLMLANSASAAPNAVREAFVEEMKNVFLGVAEIAQKAKNGASARDLYEEIKEKARNTLNNLANKFGGGGGGGGRRSKRAVHSSVTVTKFNQTNYQKLEIKKSSDQDHEKLQEAACLVQDNEVYWLELVTSALIQVMQEMKRVLEGKKIGVQMTKEAYEQSKQAYEKSKLRH
ncbi:hypothetical protein pipiens_010562 [Culex pipiens pipiens]|uniref:Uncharacterized protein n=1 Tax=Culex pipiens pipiens TaxID=38569 RepID=A0ABD1D9P6_CULPP